MEPSASAHTHSGESRNPGNEIFPVITLFIEKIRLVEKKQLIDEV